MKRCPIPVSLVRASVSGEAFLPSCSGITPARGDAEVTEYMGTGVEGSPRKCGQMRGKEAWD